MNPQHELLIKAANKLGISVERLDEEWQLEALRFRHQDQEKIIIKGAFYDSLNKIAETITDNKHSTKAFLRELGIPVPHSLFINHLETVSDETISNFLSENNQENGWVCKPLKGSHGNGIGLHMKTLQDMSIHFKRFPEYESWLIEEQVPGQDVRIQVIDGKIAAACRREPASVIGDGKKTIQELADERDQFIQLQNPINRLIIDELSESILKKQGFTKSSILHEGQRAFLKEVANMGQGARAIDITDELHPGYHEWTEKISNALDMKIYAIDILSTDHQKNPNQAAKVLEVNGKPHWLQHTFSERRQHDIPGMILKSFFTID